MPTYEQLFETWMAMHKQEHEDHGATLKTLYAKHLELLEAQAQTAVAAQELTDFKAKIASLSGALRELDKTLQQGAIDVVRSALASIVQILEGSEEGY